jgi:hypothetical protein
VIDAWWDQGLRPSDPYTGSFKYLADNGIDTARSNPTPRNPLTSQPQEYIKKEVLSKEHMLHDNRMHDTKKDTINDNHNDNNSDNNNININNNDNSRHGNDNNNNANAKAITIASPDDLLLSWQPLNRAYGWGISSTVLSTISNHIGGLAGKIMDTKPLDVVTGCYWIEIYNHENSVKNNNDNNTNDSEEFLNFIELNLKHNILKKFDKKNSKIMGVLIPISAVKMTVPGFLAGDTGFKEIKLSFENIVVGTKILVVEKTLLLRYFYV